jgi:hypothetical protein
MAAQDNLSKELFFRAHRGIAAEDPKEMNQKANVGTHWSAEKSIAEDFAVDNNEPGRTKPYVFHAEIPMSSVETDTYTLNYKSVGGAFSGEKEVPVGEGKKIRITGRTTLRKDPNLNSGKNRHRYPKSRTRTYNPPREATA